MEKNKHRAAANFLEKRYNCCQSVVCTYCEKYGVSEGDVFRMTEGFGLGMGGLMDTCGAVTGMFLAIGLSNSAGDSLLPAAPNAWRRRQRFLTRWAYKHSGDET